MMNKKTSEMYKERNQYEVDLTAIKKKAEKSRYTAFVKVRLTEKTKEELTEICRREEIYVSTLIREMIESFLKQKKKD